MKKPKEKYMNLEFEVGYSGAKTLLAMFIIICGIAVVGLICIGLK